MKKLKEYQYVIYIHKKNYLAADYNFSTKRCWFRHAPQITANKTRQRLFKIIIIN